MPDVFSLRALIRILCGFGVGVRDAAIVRDAGVVCDAERTLIILGMAQKNASRSSTDNCINQFAVIQVY